MSDTLLADLVRRQTGYTMTSIFNRTVEKVAEDLAHELLRDPEFRDEMRQLVRVAFTQALKQLHEPAPPEKPRAIDLVDQALRENRESRDKK